MIRTFGTRETAAFFTGATVKAWEGVADVAWRKLDMLNSARSLQDLMSPPSNRLEKLRGDRAGQYSIRINARWRICFSWVNGDAYDAEIVDYHR
jgi:toxin HigB-1